jgi:hypothetical protein
MSVVATSPAAPPVDPGETLSATLWLGRAFNNISPDGPSEHILSLLRPTLTLCWFMLYSSTAETFSSSVLLKHLKTDNPIVFLDKNHSPRKASNLTPSRTFSVPNNVDIHTDISTGQGDLAVYHSGDEVNHAFETDASFSASYLGVTVSGSASYSYKTQYTHDQQYAFTSSSMTAYAAEITNISQYLNPFVRKFAIGLPQWNALDLKVVQAYFDFFRWGSALPNMFDWELTQLHGSIVGTHVVIIVYSGWRIQVQIQAENTTDHAQEDFSVNITAKYLSNSVSVDTKTVNIPTFVSRDCAYVT